MSSRDGISRARAVFFCLAFFLGVAGGEGALSQTARDHTKQNEKEKSASVRDHRKSGLELTSVTRTRLQGIFKRGKIGLRFDSKRTGKDFYYVVTTLDDKVIVSGRSEGAIVTSAVGRRTKATFKRPDLNSLRALAASLKPSEGSKAKRRMRQTVAADDIVSAIKVEGSADSLRAVIEMPEYALLPALSEQLAQAGMIGNRYPPSFALHALGMAAETILTEGKGGRSNFAARQTISPRLKPNISGNIRDMLAPENEFGFCWNREDGPNLDQLPQCPPNVNQCSIAGRGGKADNEEDGCFGRCGPSCKCWSSLCGDCCFNSKCAVHDAITRKCSKFNPLTWGACVVAINPAWLIGFGCS